jgi:PPE-repeat protein
VATNFFGLNTIPIAVNEADYARMWTQAATTMTGYHATSSTAVGSTPRTAPAPQIMKADASSDSSSQGSGAGVLGDLIKGVYQGIFGQTPPPAELPDTGLFDQIGNAFYQTYLGFFKYLPQQLAGAHDPSQLMSVLFIFGAQFVFYRAMELAQILSELIPYLLPTAVGLTITNLQVAAGLATVSGFAGLSGLAGIPVGAETLPDATTAATPDMPTVGLAPSAPTTVTSTGAAPASTGAPAPAAPAAPVTGGPPPPVTGAEGPGFPYLAGGGPGVGAGAPMPAGTVVPKKAPEASAASVAAAVSTTETARARRRQRSAMHDHGNEFMDLDADLGADDSEPQQVPATTASDHGAGVLGFSGTAHKTVGAAASGLTTLPGGEFGSGPTEPMTPHTCP